jgi:hypothetical protein
MYSSIGRIGYPVSKMRLVSSVTSAVFFSILLYLASVNLKWLTVIRGLYLVLGIVEGVLVGWVEAKIVTRKLTKEAETTPWQTLLISTVSLGLPLLLTIEAFGSTEFLRYAAYLVLPFTPAFFAINGWHYNRFEKENKLQILMFPYGLKYWTEPVLDANDQFNQFTDAVASKDTPTILSQTRQSKKLIATLEERKDINPSTQSALSNILKAMNEYRHRISIIGSGLIISLLILIAYFFILAITNAFGMVEIVDNRIVSGQAIGLILLCVPTFSTLGGVFAVTVSLRKGFQKRISDMLAPVDSEPAHTMKS